MKSTFHIKTIMSEQDFQQQVIDRLDTLTTEVDKLTTEVDKANDNTERFNEKFVEYRQATQWVVQLSFSLIASATIITLASAVFKR